MHETNPPKKKTHLCVYFSPSWFQALAGLQLAGRSFGGSNALLVLRFLDFALMQIASAARGSGKVASVEELKITARSSL